MRALFLIISLMLAMDAGADAGTLLPRGEAFSNPARVLAMGAKWQGRAVAHPQGIEAAILVNLNQADTPILAPIIKQYAAATGENIVVHSGTCGVSNRGFMQKEIDMGSFCCPPGKDDRFPGLVFHTIGILPLEIIVHPANPVRDVTFSQAQRLFSGAIDRWSALSAGAAFDYPVQPVAFIHCKNRPGHWRLLLDNENLFSPRLRTVITIPDVVSAVAASKMTISLTSSYHAHVADKDRGKVRGLTIDGIAATDLAAVARGRYPLYMTLSMAYWRDSTHLEAQHRLLAHLDRTVEQHAAALRLVPAARLRQNGWRFQGEELVAAP